MKIIIALSGFFLIVIAASCGIGGGYGSDGEAIYMSGKTKDGRIVENAVDRDALQDKAMTLSCAGCHGEDGGGRKNSIPEFGPYVAPPITWTELTAPSRTAPYTEESFALAVRDGIAPEGYRLHHPMPKWPLTDEEISEIIGYLKTR